MRAFASFVVACCLIAAWPPAPADAQSAIPGFDVALGYRNETIPEKNGRHWRLTGAAEMWTAGGETKFYADVIDYYEWDHKLVAVGQVLFLNAGNRIQADRLEFNTESRTGTFFNAMGTASLGERVDKSMFGTLEPDMYFEGKTIQKIGPQRYRITQGRFTTCVQPVPRWELVSGSVVLNLDHYATLANSVLMVKGVPVFYLPFVYYPIKKDDRATGFLMPTYGTSTLRGFTLSNAFFWAINRSQDITVMHDWFTKTGQGVGTEYRYVLAPGSQGSVRFHLLNEHEVTETQPDGSVTTTPGRRSYQIRGSMNQTVSRRWRLRGLVDYFTDVTAQQTYNLNIFDASRSQRRVQGSLSGAIGTFNITTSFDRTETFDGTTNAALYGATPRVAITRGEQPIGNLPLYVTFGAEIARLDQRTGDPADEASLDQSLARFDLSPTLRFPFTKLRFLQINSSVAWHGTYWSRSQLDDNHPVDEPISRRYFDLQTRIVGPVFNRVFDTPNSGYAEKFKHAIEPFVSFTRTTATYDRNRIVKLEGTDSTVGGVTGINYGLNNRFYAKVRQAGGVATSREIASVGVSQTYYTNPDASQYDRNYTASFTGGPASHVTPILLSARVSPGSRFNATTRAEIDSKFMMLRSLGANAGIAIGNWLDTTAGWSLSRYIDAEGHTDPARLTHSLNSSATVRLAQNRYGGHWSMNVDVAHAQLIQQRFTAYYNAQCCGFAIEYQTFNFANLARVGIPQDRRFNFSFTLAGLGTFSNFFGALSGATR
jgi:hypothetical protein